MVTHDFKDVNIFTFSCKRLRLLLTVFVSLFKLFSFTHKFVENYFLYFSSLPLPGFQLNFSRRKIWVISNCHQKVKFQILIFRESLSILVKLGIPGKFIFLKDKIA